MQFPTKEQIQQKYDTALARIRSKHIVKLPDGAGPVIYISDTYPGVWLEHVYDAVCWAKLEPSMAEVAEGQCRLFLDNQKEDGQLPYSIRNLDRADGKPFQVGYSQLQECVSFASLCWETYQLLGDRDFLEYAYQGCAKWDAWLCKYRMTLQTGLIELFCVFDSGHDNSARLSGLPVACPDRDARKAWEDERLPLLAPDLNAVLYGSRIALSRMARELGNEDAADDWEKKASAVKQALMQRCYCPEDQFFYDVDKQGNFRKFRSIHIASLFQEHLLDGPLAEEIYTRYLRNPDEFWTPYPFPSMSVSDPAFYPNGDGNCWSFYAQGLTALRTLRWMEHYGKGADMEALMRKWIAALVQSDTIQFGQELHPVTGVPSNSSEWYSSTMLFFIYAVRHLGLLVAE